MRRNDALQMGTTRVDDDRMGGKSILSLDPDSDPDEDLDPYPQLAPIVDTVDAVAYPSNTTSTSSSSSIPACWPIGG